MRLKNIVRHTNKIEFQTEKISSDGGKEAKKTTAKEAPLKSFNDSMDELSIVVQRINNFTDEQMELVKILGIDVAYMKNGGRAVSIRWEKVTEINGVQHILTNKKYTFHIDREEDADGNKKGRLLLDDQSNKIVHTFLNEADKYVKGDRQQQRLPLPDEEANIEPTEGEQVQAELV